MCGYRKIILRQRYGRILETARDFTGQSEVKIIYLLFLFGIWLLVLPRKACFETKGQVKGQASCRLVSLILVRVVLTKQMETGNIKTGSGVFIVDLTVFFLYPGILMEESLCRVIQYPDLVCSC